MENKLLREVRALKDELIDTCSELVRINTVNPYSGGSITGDEAEGQAFLKEKLDALGIKNRYFEPPPDVYEKSGILGPRCRNFSGRPVLAGEVSFGYGEKTIVLNGHMDTVDVDGMEIEPFSGKVEGGKIWGRGSSDDKSGLAAGLIAIKALLSVKEDMNGGIIYQSVIDEECNGSGAGTLSCILRGLSGDFALVLDGGCMGIAPGCTGVLTARIDVEGIKGHSAYGGISALERALKVKKAVDEFSEARERENPAARTNIGVFRAGSHPAVVPSHAEIELNTVYGFDERSEKGNGSRIRKQFEEKIGKACSFTGGRPPRITWIKDLPPFMTSETNSFVCDLAGAFSSVRGEEAVFRRDQAFSDASHFAGFAGVPSAMFGPAATGVAHGPSEYVRTEDLFDCARIVALFLYRQLRR